MPVVLLVVSGDEVQNQGDAQQVHDPVDFLCLAGVDLDEHISQDTQADAGSNVAGEGGEDDAGAQQQGQPAAKTGQGVAQEENATNEGEDDFAALGGFHQGKPLGMLFYQSGTFKEDDSGDESRKERYEGSLQNLSRGRQADPDGCNDTEQ